MGVILSLVLFSIVLCHSVLIVYISLVFVCLNAFSKCRIPGTVTSAKNISLFTLPITVMSVLLKVGLSVTIVLFFYDASLFPFPLDCILPLFSSLLLVLGVLLLLFDYAFRYISFMQ